MQQWYANLLQNAVSMFGCHPCLVAVHQHILISTWHYYSGAFHPCYCLKELQSFMNIDSLLPWILDPRALRFEPSYSRLAVLQQLLTEWLGSRRSFRSFNNYALASQLSMALEN